ncbi:hypothetical protein QYM36_014331 [Artemia franciscana]|uniref:Uncharacterized protein n=1 Tax=Artemia franciscana TaxID=6661 RepID=A0AA88L5H6_ARTSF|nr:hypothetical protein QYM36_014331 [Artemia franciscana]
MIQKQDLGCFVMTSILTFQLIPISRCLSTSVLNILMLNRFFVFVCFNRPEMIRIYQKSDFCWFTLYIKSSTQDVNQETPKDYMCYEELKDGLRYTCSTYTLLRQLLGSDYMKVELMSRIHFNPGTPVIGEKPEFICVKDSKVIQLKVKELIQQFETEGFKREEIAVIETGQWKDVIKQVLRLDMNGDGEGALSEQRAL